MKYFLLFGIAASLLAPSAMAFCDVPQPRLVCAEYFASKVVVEATLVKVTSIHDGDNLDGVSAYMYGLEANRAIRGHIDGVFQVHEGNDSGRATFDWKTGRKYLLFLFYSDSDKAWELDGCGNSGPLSKASFVLSEIAAIKAARGGVIHGVVRESEEFPFTAISGVHVEAQGTTARYSATTNEEGEFHIDVPAGRYIVRVVDGAYDTALFSYEDSNVRIEPGGCAQVEFASVERPSPR